MVFRFAVYTRCLVCLLSKHGLKPILLVFAAFVLSSCLLNDEKNAEVCFVGDSITYLWDLNYFFPNEVIIKHAVSGSSIKDVNQWNLSDCEGKKTVLLIGTNDVGKFHFDDSRLFVEISAFEQQFVHMARNVHATPLIIVSILPRNAWKKDAPSINKWIEQINHDIKDSLSDNLELFEFVDVFSLFLYKNYRIREDLFKDGLHPSYEGYMVLSREIEKKL